MADIDHLDEQAAALRTTIKRLQERCWSLDAKESKGDVSTVSYSDLLNREQKLSAMIAKLEKDISNGKVQLKEQKQNIVGTLESLGHLLRSFSLFDDAAACDSLWLARWPLEEYGSGKSAACVGSRAGSEVEEGDTAGAVVVKVGA